MQKAGCLMPKAGCLVKFESSLEAHEGQHFGILFENGVILCLCCGGFFKPEDYKIIRKHEDFAGLDETLKEHFEDDLFDMCEVTPAKALPEGWKWQEWNDGSGALLAPDGQMYFDYDVIPYGKIGEIEYRPTQKTHFTTFAGTLSEYKAWCESQVHKRIGKGAQT